MRGAIRSTGAASLAVFAAAGVLAGCSGIMHPIVQVDREQTAAAASIHANPPSLSESVAYAEITRQQYRERINDQMVLENTTALALIPASALALFYGVTSSSTDAVLGLGLGAAGLYAGSNYLASKLQQYVYAAGAVALGCAVDGVAGLRAANSHLPELQLLVEGRSELEADTAATTTTSLREDLLTLETALASYRAVAAANGLDPAGLAVVTRGEAALAMGSAALARGQEGIRVLETAGSALWLTVSRIQSEVDREIISARPELSAFVAELSQGLFSVGGQLTGQPGLFAVAAPGKQLSAAVLAGPSALVDKAAEVVRRKATRVVALTDKIDGKPSAAVLERCHVDVDAAGASFAVVPAGDAMMEVAKADATSDFRISGGVPAYFVSRVGQAPAAGNIRISIPDTHGRFAITVARGTTPGRYAVQVSDSARGRADIAIVVTGDASAAAPTATTRASVASDPQIARVQRDLASIFNAGGGVDVAGTKKPVVEDGAWGPVTEAAIKQFLRQQIGVTDADMPQGRDALLTRVRAELGHS